MKTVLDVLREELEDAINSRSNALVTGAVNDYADYRHLVGVITGLTSALGRLKDLQKYDEED
jgi:hypothetical protein|tara:strand:- start:107 stop:292 length:186 start_codon:yes stop_codon:yes gene_type:complete